MKHINTTKPHLIRAFAAGSSALVIALAASPAVSAQPADQQQAPQTYQVNFSSANNSGIGGTATVAINGNQMKVSMRATGASANLPHPTHIHIGAAGVCPTPAADTDKDGYVSAKEAESTVGPIKVSFTTSGDTSSNSALATDRMPKADDKGTITYDRTFTMPSDVTAADMGMATIDIHGISTLFDDKGKYDGSKKSELDNKLPFETTVAAACGRLIAAPTGGAATGAGSTKGIESPATFVIGTTALAAAVAAGLLARKQLSHRQ